jgi:hypothetical protein
MACPEALMKQEDKYLADPRSARFESKDGSLLIYYVGSEKPLRFSPMSKSSPANQDSPKLD